MEVKVKDRQSLLDMAVQTAGSMEAAFDLAVANGVSLTATLKDGQVLATVPVRNAGTVRYYSVQKIMPATALSREEISVLERGGIGFMGIEMEFIVS